MFNSLVITCAVLFLSVDAAYFPNYIEPCSKSDPKLNDCAKANGNKAIPSLIKGDKKLKLRPLDPLQIPEINIDTSNLKIQLKDATLHGLSTMVIKDMDFDLNKQKMSLVFNSPQLDIDGTYDISGQILILPITGNGKLEASIYDAVIGYEFTFDLKERDGKQYAYPNMPTVSLDAAKSSYHLENLFNGDKRLGDEMNKFLNENDDVMLKEIGPSVRETISAIAQDIVQKVITTIPFDELVKA